MNERRIARRLSAPFELDWQDLLLPDRFDGEQRLGIPRTTHAVDSVVKLSMTVAPQMVEEFNRDSSLKDAAVRAPIFLRPVTNPIQRLVYIARPPIGVRGHSSWGRSQYSSTPS